MGAIERSFGLTSRGGNAVPRSPRTRRFAHRLLAVAAVSAVAGCQPTVKIEAPSEPITINLNIKLDADVRIQLQREAREDVRKNDIF